MNNLEKRMVDVLKDLKENYFVAGIKAEFEAEGTRMEEALRLKEVITKAGLDLTIKIGGCEAIKDMYDARAIGVNTIVAPMVETPYALKKYLQASKMVFPEDERREVKFLINVETITTVANYEQMLEIPELDSLNGIVVGRVDLTGSMGLSREDINENQIFDIVKDLFVKTKAKNKRLDCVMGGGVSAATLPFVRNLPEGHINRYETRKIIFACPGALGKDADKGILKAVGFELMWLKNKRDFYGLIYKEDAQRIAMLQMRYDSLIEEAGGKYE